jgi:dienelactone hydrolase
MTTRTAGVFVCLALTVLLASPAALAGGPRVLPEGQLPRDARLEPLKDLDGYFPFQVPATKEEWEKRAERVRRQVLVSQGLWPMPTRGPLNAVVHGKIDRGEYTVEKVYFESAPGFFVTGNLYRPKQLTGRVPAVLFSHGHWANARLSESSDAELFREIADGEERFEQGGRSRFQSMCVQLARMGCVVWQWDMLSDSDSVQLSRELVHGFAKQRPDMSTAENWGFYSPAAEAHLQSIMGLQTWNSIRSLDFLLSLPEVDPERIAMTGASGGGTQTMLLAAVDGRLRLSFPAVMVSTAMQGGCTCENASLLRVGTGNVEFAGLFAPKPQGMTTANDWTKEMSTKGFPELKQLYKLLGAPDNVLLKRGEHFPHNYNAVSRGAFYGLVNRHFKLGFKEPVLERDYQRLSGAELSVWDSEHPAPKAADPMFERALARWFYEDAQRQLTAQSAEAPRWRETMAGALDVVLGGGLEEVGTVEWDMKNKDDGGNWIRMGGLLRNTTRGEEVPAMFYYPRKWNGQTVIWLGANGKADLANADGSLQADVQRLVEAGATVVGLDLLYQGEFLADGQPLTKTPKVKNSREAAAFTFGYNRTVFAQRVHDVLGAVKFIQQHERPSKEIILVGFRDVGPIVAAARAMSGGAIGRAVIDTGGFRFGRVPDLRDPNFLPGGAKYGDIPGLLAFGGPGRLLLAGEQGADVELVRAQAKAAGTTDAVKTGSADPAQFRREAVDWLLGR